MSRAESILAAVVCACVWLAACSDPPPTQPQAQFAAAADDADATLTADDADAGAPLDAAADASAAVADAVAGDDAPADVPPLSDVADVAVADVPDVIAAPDVPDVVIAPDVPVVADIVFPSDIFVAPDAGGWDFISWPDAAVATCGDGLCTPGLESASNCPADCGGGGTWGSCAGTSCFGAAFACQAAPTCASALACATSCDNAACVQACTTKLDYATLSNTMEPLVQCAINQNCIAGFDQGPGNGPDSCGNGKCDGGETHLTCPEDCGFPVSANEQCQVANCATTYATCANDGDCVDTATCYNQYGMSPQCLINGGAAQELYALISCIQQKCP